MKQPPSFQEAVRGDVTAATAFNERVHLTNDKNVEAARNITSSNDRIFMSLAKLDHVLWKVNTYLSVLENRPVFDFVDHHNCRLGKWYEDGDGRHSFAGTPSFRGLEQPHSAVHDATRAIFEGLQAEDAQTRRRRADIAAALRRMEAGSDGVFEHLDRILIEKGT